MDSYGFTGRSGSIHHDKGRKEGIGIRSWHVKHRRKEKSDGSFMSPILYSLDAYAASIETPARHTRLDLALVTSFKHIVKTDENTPVV